MGATGFVGPYLVEHCSDCGDEVAGLGLDERGFDVTDREAVARAFTSYRPEVVYHLAAMSHVGDSWADTTACFRVNIEGTAHVLDAARSAGTRRVLVVGSSEEYGRVLDGTPLDEDAPLRPVTPYGVSKVAASYLALQAHLAHGLDTIRVRAFSHTGAGQSARFVVPALADRVARAEIAGGDAVRVGAIDPVRDVSDVRDVVRAYRLLMTRGEPGEVYNVCRGRGVAIGDIARRLVARATRTLRLEVDPELVRPVEVPCLIGSPAKLQRATGWEPRFALDETLDAVLADARARVRTELHP